jgi:hypothetical protein
LWRASAPGRALQPEREIADLFGEIITLTLHLIAQLVYPPAQPAHLVF